MAQEALRADPYLGVVSIAPRAMAGVCAFAASILGTLIDALSAAPPRHERRTLTSGAARRASPVGDV